jgi:hypothetical protein
VQGMRSMLRVWGLEYFDHLVQYMLKDAREGDWGRLPSIVVELKLRSIMAHANSVYQEPGESIAGGEGGRVKERREERGERREERGEERRGGEGRQE